MKQSKEIMHAYIQQQIYVFHFMFYINHLMFEILLQFLPLIVTFF